MYVRTVPLNCNFIFTRVITRGTTAILQCIPVACLRGPRLVVSCNVHVSWKLTRGSVRLVEAHAWKCTSRGSSRVEVYVSWKKLRRGTKHACTHMHVKSTYRVYRITLHQYSVGLPAQCHVSTLQ